MSDSDRDDEELGQEGEEVRAQIESLQRDLVITFEKLNSKRTILSNLRKIYNSVDSSM